jgi:hypothetical protein
LGLFSRFASSYRGSHLTGSLLIAYWLITFASMLTGALISVGIEAAMYNDER